MFLTFCLNSLNFLDQNDFFSLGAPREKNESFWP